MAAAPICMTCNLERTLISIKPVKNRHDMLHYECPKCRNTFRLVMQRAPRKIDEVVFDAPALQAVTNDGTLAVCRAVLTMTWGIFP